MKNESHILIVDDVMKNILLIGTLLREEGYQVSFANNGATALATVERNPPDLIFLDINMPDMDGFEVCKSLKSDARYANIPIIFLTAHDNTDRIETAFELGAVDYVTKPFRIKEVKARLETHLSINYYQKEIEGKNKKLEQTLAELELAKKDLLENNFILEEQAKDLKVAKDQAESSSRAKSFFLANMSHELRTPLNSILGFTQLMRRDHRLPKEVDENLKTINRSGEHLLALINDVLEMAKIEAGKLTQNVTSFDIRKLIKDLEEMFSLRANAKALDLQVEMADTLPQYVECDESKVRQVLINLLGNAIKFTERGNIILRVDYQSDDKQSKNTTNTPIRMLFEVEDTGIGIDEKEMKLIFEEFEQTESGRKIGGGTGLGMAISKAYVQLLGGDIVVDSQLGKGTLFRFWICVHRAQLKDVRPQKDLRRILSLKSEDQNKYRILIADDVKENRMLLSQLLTSIGFLTLSVNNGISAIDQAKQWQPHLIIMDCRMPEMDGLDAIRKIRSKLGKNNIPIIAVSASTFCKNREIAIDAGASEFLLKPIIESELFKIVGNLLSISFLYEEEGEKVIRNTQSEELIRHYLDQVPTAKINRLRDTVEIGNMTEFKKLLNDYNDFPNDLIVVLDKMADSFEYEKLLNLLE